MKRKYSGLLRGRTGFSLVEIMIALGIFSLALTVFLTVLRQSIARIERVQAEIFTILRAHNPRISHDLKEHSSWSGPSLNCTLEERALSRYKVFNLACEGSHGITKFPKVSPVRHLEWGQF